MKGMMGSRERIDELFYNGLMNKLKSLNLFGKDINFYVFNFRNYLSFQLWTVEIERVVIFCKYHPCNNEEI